MFQLDLPQPAPHFIFTTLYPVTSLPRVPVQGPSVQGPHLGMDGIENGRGIHPSRIGDELGTARMDLGEFGQVIGLRRDDVGVSDSGPVDQGTSPGLCGDTIWYVYVDIPYIQCKCMYICIYVYMYICIYVYMCGH